MTTRLNYLHDFDMTRGKARVVSVVPLGEGRTGVLLDETCFYPRGGGQDYDKGIMRSDTSIFIVDEVRMDEEGSVRHIGMFNGAAFSNGSEVELEVDAARRQLNSRIHSAGHLIDLAVDRIGLKWRPGRGAHYHDMAFVEYDGEWNAEEADGIKARIEREANSLVHEGGKNEIRFMPKEEMHTVCRFVPDYVPTNKPGRVVIYHGDFGVPCGGTHVKDLGDIGKMTITKVKKKDKNIRVSYKLSDM